MSGTTERLAPGSWLDRYGWGVVVAAGLLAYSNCFEGRLFLDDHRVIATLESQFSAPNSLLPQPLTSRWLGTWSFLTGVAAFGYSLPALHAVNLAIHLLAGVFLWGIVHQTLRLPRFEGRFVNRVGSLSTAVASLWVVHPLTTQAVTYLCQRFESQMGMFILMSVWCAIRGATASRGKVWWYALSVVAAYAATSTKEPAVVLPFVFLVYDRLFLAGSWWKALQRRWPLYLGLLAAQAALVPIASTQISAQSTSSPAPVPTELLVLPWPDGLHRQNLEAESAGFHLTGLTPWRYLRSQPEVILHYLRLTVIPAPLVLDYGWPVATNWWKIWPTGLIILMLLGVTAWTLACNRARSFFGIWFFAFLAVTSSFIPIADLAFEHRMYLPLMSLVAGAVFAADVGLVWIARHIGCRAGALKAGVALVAGTILVGLTLLRNEEYREPILMYRTMLVAVPENQRVRNNLGVEYIRNGRPVEAAEAFREVLAHSTKATPQITQLAWLNLIIALEDSKQSELLSGLMEFVTAEPENPSRRFLLAHARFRAKDFVGAVEDYRTAIEIASRNGFPLREPMVFSYYGQALFESGDPEAAIVMYRRAVALEDNLPAVHIQLGQALRRLGRYSEAEPHFRKASEQEPQNPTGPYNLGVLQMYQGKPAEAATTFKEAIRRDRMYDPAVLGLAHALHECGRPAEARQEFVAAHRLSRDWVQKTVDLSWRMSTHWDPRARYAAESLRLARLTLAGVGDQDPGLLDVLAAALAENGQFEEAEHIAGRAVKIANSGGHTSLAKEIEARHELYARRQPYRQPIASPR